MSMTLQALFDAAYGVLDRPEIKLARGSYGMESEKQFCTIGALRQAAFGKTYGYHGDEPNYLIYHQAYRMVGMNLPGFDVTLAVPRHIPSWNDENGRTKEDVLALFRSLAAKVAE